jgi:alkanesulfonate monooxygenase SsuD/methylene tetrahydromethanopterin reductase-like flavin-dependent oxidoreductase (luciferase family)
VSNDLRFGLMAPVEHHPDEDIGLRFRQMLEAVRLAEQAGFDYIDAPQHYLAASSQYLHCVPTLARIAAETERVQLCTNIIQLTLHNPVEIAESLATLDVLSGGRLVAGFGLGYNPREFDAFGVRSGTRLRRFLEALQVVKRLWTEDEIDHDGEFFKLEAATAGVRPLQSPRPAIIVAASGDRMVVRSARIGDALSLAGHSNIDGLARQAALYREALGEAGIHDLPRHYRLMLETHVGKDTETARHTAMPHLARKYGSYSSMGQDGVLPQGQTFSSDIEELARDRFVIGGPQEVAERLAEYVVRTGVRELGTRMHWIGMPHRDVMSSIELYAEKVIPVLRR